MHPYFDRRLGILDCMYSLEKFTTLIKDRKNAVTSEPDTRRLHEYVINGQLVLDKFGQVAKLFAIEKCNGDYKNVTEGIRLLLDPVMTMSEFKRRIKPYNVSFNYGFDRLGPLPTQHTKCQCCGETWSIDNICDYITKSDTCLSSNLKHTIPEAEYKRVAHALSFRFIVNDAQPTQLAETLNRITGSSWSVHYEDDNPENKISHYNFLKYYHKACYANFLSKKVATEFIEALRSAGIGIYGMIRTKNKYGSEAYNGPWFIFDTSIGHLRLGWRKSVIEISYAAIDNQYISKTERTAGPGYEHICDSSQLTEALIKFKAHLNARGVASNSIPDMVFNS